MIVKNLSALLHQYGSSFRLLNSEIGNDLKKGIFKMKIMISFRLLNSEIGNDLF